VHRSMLKENTTQSVGAQGGNSIAADDSLYNGWTAKRASMDFHSFDAEYVQKLAMADPATESHFSGYFAGIISKKLRGRGVSKEMAEDVCQETMLRVLKAVRSGVVIAQPERFGAFVNAVSHNVLLELSRKHWRHPPLADDAPEPADDHPGADTALITEERKHLVAAVLEQLSVTDREILRLVFFQEEDRESISHKFNVEPDYLRVLLHRAKSRFRAAYMRRRGAAGGAYAFWALIALNAHVASQHLRALFF
jgi:RNA polymerase sigma-70 factor, ECF subfamily